jgi:hypothetical protein
VSDSAMPVSASHSGVFAAGHLGELTWYLPFELVDDVLERTRTVQRRLRDLPSRVGVYFVLALGLYPGLGYRRVWDKLTAGLRGRAVPCPSEKGLRDLRRRLGPAPFKMLFEVLAGPLARPHTPGVRFAGLRTVAFDGCNSLKVPDTDANRCWLGRIRYRMGFAGYPTVALMTLVETGTRALIGATLGSAGDRDEPGLARRLLGLLRPDMLVLLDRAFDSNTLFAEITGTGAKLLGRCKSTRNPAVLEHLPDGSYLSELKGLPVRMIDAEVVLRGSHGRRVAGQYRLVTTLLDDRRYPARALIRLYHERWEIEIAYLALRHTLLNGHVLRSGDRVGLEQELWALLVVYQLLRIAMVAAVETSPGLDPDRASFTSALQAARDQLIAAPAITPDDGRDRSGAIGSTVLATLLPDRRARHSARIVKSYHSRYDGRGRDPRPQKSATITAIDVAISTPLLRQPKPVKPRPAMPPGQPRADTRRHNVVAIMARDPQRAWRGHELAELLQVKPRNLLTQLGEWTRLGLFTRVRKGAYQLAAPDTPAPNWTNLAEA